MAFAHSPKIVTDGLVLALDAGNPKSYPGSGTSVYDRSGNGYDGALINGPTFSSEKGGAIDFDGASDYLYNETAPLGIANRVTVLTWVKADTQTGYGQIIGSATQYPFFRWQLRRSVNVTPNIYSFEWNNQYDKTPIPASIVEDGGWHMLGGRYDGTSVSSIFDGEIYANYSYTSGNIPTNNGYSIGQYGPPTNNYYWGGLLSQALVYNRALSASEIQQNYNALKGRFGL